MPPANSPDREPTPFTSALRGLESAVDHDVLNLAATLTPWASTTRADEADEADARGDEDDARGDEDDARIRLQQLERAQGNMDAAQSTLRFLRSHLARDERRLDDDDRLRRSMHRLTRLHDAYSDHIPAHNSLHDWAPLPAAPSDALRATAVLHAARRHPRFAARAQHHLQTRSPAPAMLEHAVTYLARLRHTSDPDAAVHCARNAGLDDHASDFLTNVHAIPPPQPSSWLAPGAVLAGCQHATAPLTTDPTTSLTARAPTPHQDRWPVRVTVHAVDWAAMTLAATMEAYNVPSHPHLASPARYTRTSSITTYLEGELLDFATHSLLTESFKSCPATDALYWRKLPPFRDLDDDAVVSALTSASWWAATSSQWILMRWKERCFVKSLRPGTKTTTADSPPPVAQTQILPETQHPPHGPHWLDDQHAAFDDSGCGLTISGFYYVCLRRSDGRVEGLYYDPMSSPYQCLVLESRARGGWGSWSFA